MRERVAGFSATTELLLINGICFGWFILGSVSSVVSGVRDFANEDAGLLTLVFYEIFAGAIAMTILARRGWSGREFNLAPTTLRTLAGVCLFGLLIGGMTLTQTLAHGLGAPASFFNGVTFNGTASGVAIGLLSLVNGLYEELFVVGYNLRALESHGAAYAITFSAFVRFLYHLYQGPIAAVQILVFGLICAAVYWRWRRLWPLVVAHALADWIALTLAT